MSAAGLRDLLERMREHPAFGELLSALEAPGIKGYRPSKDEGPEAQKADWVFRSGRRQQHELWRQFLATHVPPEGEAKPSQQEKS